MMIYEWAKQHLNWTLFFSWLIAGGLVFGGYVSTSNTTPTPDELFSDLLVYQDGQYIPVSVWIESDIPPLQWIDSTSETESPYEWKTAHLELYLKNKGDIPIKVEVSSSSEMLIYGTDMTPKYAIPGYSVSSEAVILSPNESNPIDIIIKMSPEVLSFSSFSTDGGFYFHVLPLSSDSSNSIIIALTVIAILIFLPTEIWYLKQKHRSLWNLCWNLLSWIGFIVILSLENYSTRLNSTNHIDNQQYV